MKKNKIIIIGVIALLLGACSESYFECIRGNGVLTSEVRTSGAFQGVLSSGDYIVQISKSDNTSVVVEAEENIIEYIDTRISGNTLIIETRGVLCIMENEPIKVFITMPELERLKLSGSGKITTDAFEAEEFSASISGSGEIETDLIEANNIKLDVSGSGDISMAVDSEVIDARISGSGNIGLFGYTDSTELSISASGSFECLDLEQDQCDIHISGSGNCYVNVASFLDVRISGSGDVYYLGSPEITSRISGSGRILKY